MHDKIIVKTLSMVVISMKIFIIQNHGISIDNLDGGEYCHEDNTRRYTVEWDCHERDKRALLYALKKSSVIINPKEILGIYCCRRSFYTRILARNHLQAFSK